MKTTHTSLDEERAKISFDVHTLSNIYHGDSQKADAFVKVQDIAAKDPLLKFDPSKLGLSRIETVRNVCQRLARFHQLFDFSKEETAAAAFALSPDQMPGGQHTLMFMRSIKSLGTEDQIKKWIPLSESFKVNK
jgi:acyl-CoA oxidase